MKNKWKVIAIVFIIASILFGLATLFFINASRTSYNQMYENACGQTCYFNDYESFEMIEDRCYCSYPENSSYPFKIEVGKNEYGDIVYGIIEE